MNAKFFLLLFSVPVLALIGSSGTLSARASFGLFQGISTDNNYLAARSASQTVATVAADANYKAYIPIYDLIWQFPTVLYTQDFLWIDEERGPIGVWAEYRTLGGATVDNGNCVAYTSWGAQYPLSYDPTTERYIGLINATTCFHRCWVTISCSKTYYLPKEIRDDFLKEFDIDRPLEVQIGELGWR